ncbi:MAG: type I restriction-modification system subunit M [Candidatus Cryosericum sp.]
MARGKTHGNITGANLGFEAKLWSMADSLRGSMDSAEYKHVVLGLVFLKYISDRFEERQTELVAQAANPIDDNYIKEPGRRYVVAEDRDQYTAKNVFWVPEKARWSAIKNAAKQGKLGVAIDDAMIAIETENPLLLGVLPKEYARQNVDEMRLAKLVDIVSTIGMTGNGINGRDIIGKVYEYFLKQFARAEGKKGGEFLTPPCVVQTLVAMIAPLKGRVYDPCMGTGSMFVSSEGFVEAHSGKLGFISVYGQELNYTTWRLAKMNLAIHGIESTGLAQENADTFTRDLHPDLRADYILANPPFNLNDWYTKALKDDPRWKQFGLPPEGNANYAWIEHMIYHLASHGQAGFVMANGSMTTNTSGEGEIRKKIVESDLVDCMVAMPGQLFYTTSIPVCLWFLAKFKGANRFHDRRRKALFIDARKMGTLVDRVHRELTPEDIERISGTYHAWRGDPGSGEYADIAGFCKSATVEEIAANGYVLTPGRYAGSEEVEDDPEASGERMKSLTTALREEWAGGAELDAQIARNLKEIGYGK